MCSSVSGCWLDFACAGLSSLIALALLGTPISKISTQITFGHHYPLTMTLAAHARANIGIEPSVWMGKRSNNVSLSLSHSSLSRDNTYVGAGPCPPRNAFQ